MRQDKAGLNGQKKDSLAYRMPKSVRYHDQDGSQLLILGFPLKIVVLNPFWKPLFESLSTGKFLTFDRIVSSVNHSDPDRVEILLNRLVRKGFLEQEGLSILSHYPSVSVIIPVRNRPEKIAACLDSLGQIDYPLGRTEIIVVDDASEDRTPEVASRYPVNLIPLKEPKQASFCRNRGAQTAKGEILAFVDSDCLTDPLWLRELLPAFKDPSVGAVGGLVDSHSLKDGLERYEKVRSSLNMGLRFKSSHEGDLFFYVPSCNLLVRRELFLGIGGFRTDMHVGEDVDLCWRLQDEGYHVEYRPVGRVLHKHRNKLRAFCRRRFDYGTSEPLLQHRHPNREKHFVFPPGESLFWGLIILAMIFKWIPMVGLSGLVILMDSINRFIALRRRDIPIEFPTLFLAMCRSYFAFMYRFSAFVSRYYLFWFLLICPLLPLASSIILGMHFLTGIVEYSVRKPQLNLMSFLFYFSLDQLSYQSGVWWGCVRWLYFRPVKPKIIWKRPSKKPSCRIPPSN